jgi:hypothetical protein
LDGGPAYPRGAVDRDVSIREGGGQIEYADQDPRIHALWLSELGKTGVRSRMGKLFDQA